MGSGMLGFSIAKSSLQAHQRALETTSQNLANANTEGYARKVVHFESMGALNIPDVSGPGTEAQIGMGVNVAKIQSVRDLILNARIREMKSELQENDRQREVLDQVEALFAGEVDIARSMDDFFSAVDDLSSHPDSLTVRSVVRARGQELGDSIRSAATGLEEIRADLNDEVADIAAKINSITADIARLNEQVAGMVSNGFEGNDFEDKRELRIEELAEYVDVQIVRGEVDAISVMIGGQLVVTRFTSNEVEVNTSTDTGKLSTLRINGEENLTVEPTTGILKGLQILQESSLEGLRDDLNELAIVFTQSFNAIHSTGFGLDGSTGTDFFTVGEPSLSEQRVFSVTSSVFVEDTGVALDGLTTTTQPENFETNPIGVGAFIINGQSVSYDGSVDSLETIRDRINASSAAVTASITPQNRLTISATSQGEFEISTMADGGNFLSRLGILAANTAFPPNSNTTPSSVFTGSVTLRPGDDAARKFDITTAIKNDLNKIAAAQGDDLSDPPDGIGDRSRGPGDGANALLLAELRTGNTMAKATASYNDFLVATLGDLGVKAGSAKRTVAGMEAQIEQLEVRRQEIQGVSIDEELINMIKYQRGFQAAARVISTMDEILQTIISLGR